MFGNPIRKPKNNESIYKCIKCGRPKLYVNLLNGLYHCFRCGFSGKLKTKINLSDLKNVRDAIIDDSNNEMKLIPLKTIQLTEEQKQKLKDRGITDQDIKFYNICGRKSDHRIQIPNYVYGCLTDFICAWEWDKTLVTDKNPKYLNISSIKKSNLVFNLHNIEDNIDQIIICEGIFNAITAGKNAVATLGCDISDKQCDLILDKKPKCILIALDSDEPGVTGSLKFIEKLKQKQYLGKVEYILLPNNVDVNDLGHINFVEYCKNNKVNINLNSLIGMKLPKLLFDSRK